MNDPPEETTLVIVPVADPLTRYGHAERSPDYRLKCALKELLRKYGFKVVRVTLPKPETPRPE